jgi:hypothetical protein
MAWALPLPITSGFSPSGTDHMNGAVFNNPAMFRKFFPVVRAPSVGCKSVEHKNPAIFQFLLGQGVRLGGGGLQGYHFFFLFGLLLFLHIASRKYKCNQQEWYDHFLHNS